MKGVIDRLREILSSSPEAILSGNRIGSRRPSGSNEVPSISIALVINNVRVSGLGRYVRFGDEVVKHTAQVVVESGSEQFDADLSRYRIWPLPLRRNPSSTAATVTVDDVAVRNVSDLAQPIDYTLVEEPATPQEYRVDERRGLIAFGQPQTEGEQLEVVHWTVSWRDEIFGDHYNGTLNLEAWLDSFQELNDLSRGVQQKLRAGRTLLRQRGFLKLEPGGITPAERVLREPPTGSPFPVWTQTLHYRFAFEGEEGGEISAGTRIRRIDVELDKEVDEPFSIR